MTAIRQKLSLPSNGGAAKKMPPPVVPETPVLAAPPPKRRVDEHREFQLTDGRPICLYRNTVSFATPCKEQPDKVTIVGLKMAKAVPLRIAYEAFMQWWIIKR
jgi:hypothetical protein